MPMMEQRGRKSGGRPLDAAAIDDAALSYLNRFDSSVANLRRTLEAKVARALREGVLEDPEPLREAIEATLERLSRSGVLDDRRYASTRALSLRRRGDSARAIRHKLREKGVDGAIIDEVLEESDGDVEDAELQAARALVRRRRLGSMRPEAEREGRRERDLAALARAGFSFDVSRRALEVGIGDDEA
jgi:regulatory protein